MKRWASWLHRAHCRAAVEEDPDGLRQESDGVERRRRLVAEPHQPRPPAEVPEDIAAALVKNRKARATFDAFSNSNRRGYVEWISEAKRAPTRAQRVAQTIEWLAEGKPLNWKYMNC